MSEHPATGSEPGTLAPGYAGAPPAWYRPLPTVGGRPLAGYGARVGAHLIDGLAVLVLSYLVALTLAFTVPFEEPLDTAERFLVALGLATLLTAPVFPLYALVMLRSGERRGQTLGKQALGIRVVREDVRTARRSASAVSRSGSGSGSSCCSASWACSPSTSSP